jgi:peptidoglycan hydrolase-like protein with peptidoglycan-binding domain
MNKKWKIVAASAVAATLAIGTVGVTHANAATKTYTKGDAQFCADHLKNVVLNKGEEGNCVRVLQQLLNKAGASPKLTVDGDFGPATDKAVKEREKKLKWKIDGKVSTGHFENLKQFAPAGKATITGVVTNKSTKPASSGSKSSGSSSGSSGSKSSSGKSTAPKKQTTAPKKSTAQTPSQSERDAAIRKNSEPSGLPAPKSPAFTQWNTCPAPAYCFK